MKHQGISEAMVFCPFFARIESTCSAVLCQTCEEGVRHSAKHFGSRVRLAKYMHAVCYCTDYAKKCTHAAMMNNFYSGGIDDI